MFRLEAFCEDKNLARVYHVLTGLVIDLKVQPVANGKAVNGKMRQISPGNKVDLFKQFAKIRYLKTVTPTMLKEFTVGIGLAEKSYSLVLKELKEAKAIRKVAGSKGNKISYAVTL